jgi:hypothetical protein
MAKYDELEKKIREMSISGKSLDSEIIDNRKPMPVKIGGRNMDVKSAPVPSIEADDPNAMVELPGRNKVKRSNIKPVEMPEFEKGGKVSSASSRADGIAQKGKTKGRIC